MAELVDARMEAHRRRLPFEPAYPDDDRKRWLPFGSRGERLYAGSKAVRFHLRGQRSTVLRSPASGQIDLSSDRKHPRTKNRSKLVKILLRSGKKCAGSWS